MVVQVATHWHHFCPNSFPSRVLSRNDQSTESKASRKSSLRKSPAHLCLMQETINSRAVVILFNLDLCLRKAIYEGSTSLLIMNMRRLESVSAMILYGILRKLMDMKSFNSHAPFLGMKVICAKLSLDISRSL